MLLVLDDVDVVGLVAVLGHGAGNGERVAGRGAAHAGAGEGVSHPASRRRRTAAVVAVLPRLVRAWACTRWAATHTRSGPVDAWSA